jgi:crotonobetainyl-CoA:carnitine CoA-transferase CaiB-like acyl-CoA transferase
MVLADLGASVARIDRLPGGEQADHDRVGPGWPARIERRARHQLHRAHRRPGRDRAARPAAGQVVDAAITDGAALLMTLVHLLHGQGLWNGERGTNLFDSGAPFYDVYETADGRYVSVGAVEPQFYEQFLARLGPFASGLPAQYDRSQWPAAKERMADIFRRRTQAEWCQTFAGTDACVAPGGDTDALLAQIGRSGADVRRLRDMGVVG